MNWPLSSTPSYPSNHILHAHVREESTQETQRTISTWTGWTEALATLTRLLPGETLAKRASTRRAGSAWPPPDVARAPQRASWGTAAHELCRPLTQGTGSGEPRSTGGVCLACRSHRLRRTIWYDTKLTFPVTLAGALTPATTFALDLRGSSASTLRTRAPTHPIGYRTRLSIYKTSYFVRISCALNRNGRRRAEAPPFVRVCWGEKRHPPR
jgi:hypothetical protein